MNTRVPDTLPELRVLFHDDWLLVVMKPSGLVVHNGWAREEVNALSLARRLARRHVYPLHRLDRGCSGVLAFALSSERTSALQSALAAPGAYKRYLALVRGITPACGHVDYPLAKTKGGDKRPAITHFRRLATFERYTLLEATPLTGRLHQLRRHLRHLGHPLIGDVRYGKREHNHLLRDRFGLGRLALHATTLSFVHPGTNLRLDLNASLPDDLAQPLARMGLTWPEASPE